jgi:hypothetical protein
MVQYTDMLLIHNVSIVLTLAIQMHGKQCFGSAKDLPPGSESQKLRLIFKQITKNRQAEKESTICFICGEQTVQGVVLVV